MPHKIRHTLQQIDVHALVAVEYPKDAMKPPTERSSDAASDAIANMIHTMLPQDLVAKVVVNMTVGPPSPNTPTEPEETSDPNDDQTIFTAEIHTSSTDGYPYKHSAWFTDPANRDSINVHLVRLLTTVFDEPTWEHIHATAEVVDIKVTFITKDTVPVSTE